MLQPISVSSGCISRVLIETEAPVLVLDDLSFTPGRCSNQPVVSLDAITAGDRTWLAIDAPRGTPGVVMISDSRGPTATSMGELQLGLPLLAAQAFATSTTGTAAMPVPPLPALHGRSIAQVWAVDQASGRVLISSPVVL